MKQTRILTLATFGLVVVSSATAQSVRLTGPKAFDADGTILISGRLGWTQSYNNGYSTGKLKLVDWYAYTRVHYDYRLEVQEWFVPVFDRNLVYEGPIARIKFIGNPHTLYPADALIGIGFLQASTLGQESYYAAAALSARVDTNPNPPPVPEPATLIALSAGLVALVRKRRN